MNFISGGMYHVYNQGNNRQIIFFKRENYFFFLRKIRAYFLPYVDVLAYCLMPNHFHLMVYVRDVEIPSTAIVGVTSHPDSSKLLTLNTSIGIMLRSYTRAINKQERRSGALFREETKAICLNAPKSIVSGRSNSSGIAIMNSEFPEIQYPQVCFNYIHNNPVKSGFVESPGDWQFSSYKDILEENSESFINFEKVKDLGLLSGWL